MFQLPSQASVVASVASKHYGVSAHTSYDQKIDEGQDKWWSEEYEKWQVDRMTWYIEKGDDLERSRKIEFPFYWIFPPNPSHDLLQVNSVLLECSLDDKPVHPQEGKSFFLGTPYFFTQLRGPPDVVKNCTLSIDLSVIPESQFKKKSRISSENGTLMQWWELHHKMLVTIQSGPMLFSMQCGGKEYGSVSTEY